MGRSVFGVLGTVVALGFSLVMASCLVEYNDPDRIWWDPSPTHWQNEAPAVLEGYAGCRWDAWDEDDLWVFEAVVDDSNGAGDVVEVIALVYDQSGGGFVQGFALAPTDDPWVWRSEWLGSETTLAPLDTRYQVKLVAWDSWGDDASMWVDAEVYPPGFEPVGIH